ncbi:MAG: TetR/AcrR family transcriptional regulator [Hyphomicrobiaceae bacterium]
MARPREFDLDVAIDRAMDVFWANGYDGASLPDLLDGIGITRGSLYKAFNDKRSLFLLVLSRYEEEAVSAAVEHLSSRQAGDGWVRIKTLFAGVIATVRKGDRRGCLLCQAAAGPASQDPDIAKLIHKSLDRMRRAFEKALADSPRHGSLSDAELHSAADALVVQYVGLRTMARSQAPLASLERSVKGLEYLPGAPDKEA